MEVAAVFPQQPGQPVARESPEPVAPRSARTLNQPAKARIVRVNLICPHSQYDNPTARQFRLQPDARLLLDSRRHRPRDDGRVDFNALVIFQLLDAEVDCAVRNNDAGEAVVQLIDIDPGRKVWSLGRQRKCDETHMDDYRRQRRCR